MSLDPQFLDWMNATIAIENQIGTSSGGYGGRKFSASVPVLARIEQFITKMQSHEGKEVVTKGRMFVAPIDSTSNAAAVMIRTTDRVTIPSGYIFGADTQPRVINVEQHNDEQGSLMYYEVVV